MRAKETTLPLSIRVVERLEELDRQLRAAPFVGEPALSLPGTFSAPPVAESPAGDPTRPDAFEPDGPSSGVSTLHIGETQVRTIDSTRDQDWVALPNAEGNGYFRLVASGPISVWAKTSLAGPDVDWYCNIRGPRCDSRCAEEGPRERRDSVSDRGEGANDLLGLAALHEATRAGRRDRRGHEQRRLWLCRGDAGHQGLLPSDWPQGDEGAAAAVPGSSRRQSRPMGYHAATILLQRSRGFPVLSAGVACPRQSAPALSCQARHVGIAPPPSIERRGRILDPFRVARAPLDGCLGGSRCLAPADTLRSSGRDGAAVVAIAGDASIRIPQDRPSASIRSRRRR